MNRFRLLALAACVAAGCSSTLPPPGGAQFAGPSGMAATSAGDRDVLFIANTGRDSLRALQICTGAPTCTDHDAFQFVPAPLRLIPASVEVSDRPVRIAGVRLCAGANPDGSCPLDSTGKPVGPVGGVAVVAGNETSLRVIDARQLVLASQNAALQLTPMTVPLDPAAGPAVDVVGANALDPAQGFLELPRGKTRFAAVTQGAASPAQLRVYEVATDSTGAALQPTLVAWCSLGAVLPTRLALAPGDTLPSTAPAAPTDFPRSAIYVADGAGDGAVRVFLDAMAPASAPIADCGATRIPFGNAAATPYKPVPLRAIALSPRWFPAGATAANPSGEVLAGVTTDGAVSFARVFDGTNYLANLFPTPPASYTATGVETMESLQPVGLAREIAFLPLPPLGDGSANTGLACNKGPCTPILMRPVLSLVGPEIKNFQLLAAVSTSDGSTWFVDAINRRFLDTNFSDAQDVSTNTGFAGYLGRSYVPATSEAPHLVATRAVATSPVVTFGDGFRPGVTRAMRWRVFWHGSMPGLEAREGTLTTQGGLVLSLGPIDLTPWVKSPELALAAGDAVAIGAATSTNPACAAALADPTQLPNVELPITAISGNSLALNPSTAPPFPPAACAGATLQVTAAVRAAGAAPWMVLEANTIRGRTASKTPFVAQGSGDPRGARYDYPFDYTLADAAAAAGGLPSRSNDLSLSFTIDSDLDATQPALGGSFLTWVIDTRRSQVVLRDPFASGGGPLYPYRYGQGPFVLLYQAVTGTNELLQADVHSLSLGGAVNAYH